jgi:hypothetical protein
VGVKVEVQCILDIEMEEGAATGKKLEEDIPEYLKVEDGMKFLNISLKGYEKKTSSSGFTKEEYYAYRIVSMYVCWQGAISWCCM